MGTHGYIKITANATDPQNRIDVTAGTEGGELTARGIAVNYAAGATTTIARTAFGYSAVVTLTLPTGSSAGSLNISVPAELNITNGSIAIGRFVWNLAAEGDYVFTANGLLETVHIVAPPAPPTFAIISGPYPASITKNTATIVWKTNMLSNSTVKYGLNTWRHQ